MRRTLENALDEAIESFVVDAEERLRFQLRLAFFPDSRRAVLSFLKQKAAEEGIDIDEFEKWIALIIKYLPMIIALFM